MNRTGARFGRYETAGVLGQGGFAIVYRAWDPILGREVALKALLPHLSASGEVRRRFLAEIQALAYLRHPHIVTVFDAGEELGQPYFTMELIAGPTLGERLDAGERFAFAQVAALFGGLCSAVDYLHAAGYVHRDIKPGNVMQDAAGRVVLMDFGIARALDGTYHTRNAAGLGTVEYMSPEQVRGQQAGPAADIYALGVLAFHLLADRPPFEGDTAFVLHAHAFDAPDLDQLRGDVPASAIEAIAAALAKDPQARPPNAVAFANTLAAKPEPAVDEVHQAVPDHKSQGQRENESQSTGRPRSGLPSWWRAKHEQPAPFEKLAQAAKRRSGNGNRRTGLYRAAGAAAALAIAGLVVLAFATRGTGGSKQLGPGAQTAPMSSTRPAIAASPSASAGGKTPASNQASVSRETAPCSFVGCFEPIPSRSAAPPPVQSAASGQSVSLVACLGGLLEPNQQVVRYTVRSGESLFSIAARCETQLPNLSSDFVGCAEVASGIPPGMGGKLTLGQGLYLPATWPAADGVCDEPYATLRTPAPTPPQTARPSSSAPPRTPPPQPPNGIGGPIFQPPINPIPPPRSIVTQPPAPPPAPATPAPAPAQPGAVPPQEAGSQRQSSGQSGSGTSTTPVSPASTPP